jgi:uncharacterized iron-regulated membrane protein
MASARAASDAMTFKKIHRVLGLFMAAFWLVQALTGVLLTFRQELDNVTLPGRGAPVATADLGRRIESIQHAGGRVTSLWVADFAADQFDLRYVTAGTGSSGGTRKFSVRERWLLQNPDIDPHVPARGRHR